MDVGKMIEDPSLYEFEKKRNHRFGMDSSKEFLNYLLDE